MTGIGQTIVSAHRIQSALRGRDPHAALKPRPSALEAATADDPGAPAKAATISSILAVLWSAEKHPDVMTTVHDQAASLFQSYLAERAAEHDAVTDAPAGGFEAKFDDHDIGGWIKSFFSWWQGL